MTETDLSDILLNLDTTTISERDLADLIGVSDSRVRGLTGVVAEL